MDWSEIFKEWEKMEREKTAHWEDCNPSLEQGPNKAFTATW